MKQLIYTVVIITLLTSCFKDDEMVPKHDPGDVIVDTIAMTQYYNYQLYYNLNDSNVVSSNEREIFDINFECVDTSTVIRLNTANFALIAETDFKTFEQVNDTVGLEWHFDKSDGDVDSLAINNWINIDGSDTTYSDRVWVLDRGLSPLGIALGLKKVKFTKFENNTFFFSFCNMDNSDLHEVYVSKDPDYEYVQYSLSNGGEKIQTEPMKNTWDLLFTQYTTLLYTNEGQAYPYIVNGVLQSKGTKIAIDSTMNFEDIVLSDTLGLEFSKKYDVIGYDWKRIEGDVETGNYQYVARTEWNYIIRDNNSFYYKLRFIGFYNKVGVKGYPSFEYARL
ncbi:MAG: hypothetical protein C0595_05435 [Marinilabiliales bacterium]|nr:MAG: hypothetical protein C0595_05435 [Marinilabiliales bacterium]